MRKPDAYLGVTGHNHSQVAASIMLAFERELDGHPAQVVLVVDDMTATMSCSIVAKKRGLKVAHVIAGTRSFDMNMPREVNRTIVDAISDYLFTISIGLIISFITGEELCFSPATKGSEVLST